MGRSLTEVKARAAELEAIIAEAKAAEAAAELAIAPARKRRAALTAKLSKLLVLTTAGGQPNSDQGGVALKSIATISIESFGSANLKEKELAAALVAGKVKIGGGGYGVSYSLRGFLQRSRMIELRQLRGVNKARAKREAAQAALREAWRAEREAYSAAYETGTKPDHEAIAAAMAKRHVINVSPVVSHDLQQKASDAARWGLPRLQQHLDWAKAKNPDKGVCPCPDCAQERAEVIRHRDLVAKLAPLPKRRVKCPQHGGKIMAAETLVGEWVDIAGKRDWYRDVPAVWCPVGPHRLIDVPSLVKRLTKAAAKARPVAKIGWVCPNGDGPQESEVQADRDDGVKWVECPECETAFELDAVKLVEAKKAA